MKKEKRKSIILPKYNEEHPSDYQMVTPWFMEFVPEGVIQPEAVGPKKNIRLLVAFKEIEDDVNASFHERVKEEFGNYYVEALADEEIIRCLPHKPKPIRWEDLNATTKKEVVYLYKDGKSKGYVESTIRKHIRHYFADKAKKEEQASFNKDKKKKKKGTGKKK